MNGIVKLFKGYGGILTSGSKKILTAFKILLFLCFVFALSLGIVYPLWILATKSAETYTFVVIVTFLSLIVIFLIFRVAKMIYNNGIKESYITYFLPKIKKLGKILVITLSVLLLVYIFAYSIIYGIIITTLLILFFGYFRFVYKK